MEKCKAELHPKQEQQKRPQRGGAPEAMEVVLPMRKIKVRMPAEVCPLVHREPPFCMGGKITGGSGALVAPSQAANTSIQTVDTERSSGSAWNER